MSDMLKKSEKINTGRECVNGDNIQGVGDGTDEKYGMCPCCGTEFDLESFERCKRIVLAERDAEIARLKEALTVAVEGLNRIVPFTEADRGGDDEFDYPTPESTIATSALTRIQALMGGEDGK